MALRNELGKMFSSDDKVIDTIAVLAPIAGLFQVSPPGDLRAAVAAGGRARAIALTHRACRRCWLQVFDAVQGVTAGVFRGIGRQCLIAGIYFLGLWAIGLTVGATLTFELHLGVKGLWFGLCAGLGSSSCLFLLLFSRVDWDAEVARATRMNEEAKMVAYTSADTPPADADAAGGKKEALNAPLLG